MKFINIAPTSRIGLVGNDMEMILPHIIEKNKFYTEKVLKTKLPLIVDNSYFELGKSYSTERVLGVLDDIGLVNSDVTVVLPDGSIDGLNLVKDRGYKVMAVPTDSFQLFEYYSNQEVDLMGLSEQHFGERHNIHRRYELLRELSVRLKDPLQLTQKKIHILGGTHTLWELGVLSPFKKLIHSWDTSMPVWQGLRGNYIWEIVEKDITPVDFDAPLGDGLQSKIVAANLLWVSHMVKTYYKSNTQEVINELVNI